MVVRGTKVLPKTAPTCAVRAAFEVPISRCIFAALAGVFSVRRIFIMEFQLDLGFDSCLAWLSRVNVLLPRHASVYGNIFQDFRTFSS